LVIEAERHDLLEILDSRYRARLTIVAGQLATTQWHD
jgi:hypothetical protein